MSIVCFILAALCLGYFWLIAAYSGIGTDFCAIWIFFFLVFLIMGIFMVLERKNRENMPKRLPLFIYTTFALWSAVGIIILTFIARYGSVEDTQGCDYCIVIGDRVYEDGISSTLKKRLDKACEYCKNNPETVLVLSGGTDSGDILPEALAMFNYLANSGVPENRMIIEAESDDTAGNIENSLEVISDDLKTRMVPPPIMIGVITSDYHVFRTVKTAESITEERIYPITADSDPVLFIHQCVRECCAIIRDRLSGRL